MSDDTYYNILEVPETATQAEIKAAYRKLIKQIHPDTLANLPPYLRGLAEDKAKEMTEAYSVLSDVTKRRQYDRLIAEHRQRNAPAQHPTPSKAAATPSPGAVQCVKCGSQNKHDYSFCIVCGASVKKKDKAASNTSPPSPGPQTQSSQRGYNWQPLRLWAGQHPVLACGLGSFIILGIVGGLWPESNVQPSPNKVPVATPNPPQQLPPIPPLVPQIEYLRCDASVMSALDESADVIGSVRKDEAVQILERLSDYRGVEVKIKTAQGLVGWVNPCKQVP
jgi:hypothetical protein